MSGYLAAKPGYHAGKYQLKNICINIYLKPQAFLWLHLKLNYSQGEYADWLNIVGMRIIIHEADETIFPDINGYNLPPGYDVAFSLRKVNFRKKSLFHWKSSLKLLFIQIRSLIVIGTEMSNPACLAQMKILIFTNLNMLLR